MKVKLTIDCDGPNYEFDRDEPISPTNHPTRVVPAGTEIEHPDAWRLCMPEPETEEVRAEPVDEEAASRLKAALELRDLILKQRAEQKEKRAAQRKQQRKKGRRRSR